MRALLLMMLPLAAPAETWTMHPSSEITIRAGYDGGPLLGVSFPRFAGRAEFDPTDPAATRAEIAVAAGSAATGLPFVNRIVAGPDLLDAGAHPEIRFSLTDLVQTGTSTARVSGQLTVKGVTRPVTLTAVLRALEPAGGGQDRAWFDLSGQIDRVAFGLGGDDLVDDLPVEIRLELRTVR